MKKIKESELKYYTNQDEWLMIRKEAIYKFGTVEKFAQTVLGMGYVNLFRKCSIKYPNYCLSHVDVMKIETTLGIKFKVH